MMGIDEAGQHDVPGHVDHLVGRRRQVGRAPDGDDPVVLDEHRPAGDLPPVGVHRDEHVGVADQQRLRHGDNV